MRLMVKGRLQAHLDKMMVRSFKEGLEESLERIQDLVRRAAARQFGADGTQHLDPILAASKCPERLFSVAGWIIDNSTGLELLAGL